MSKPFQINDSISMLIAVVLFSATILIMLLILLKNVDMTFLANYDEFNQKMTFLFIAVIISLAICLSWKRIGSRNALYMGIALIVLTLVSGLVGASLGSDVLFSLSLPAFLVGALAALYRVVKAYVKGSWRKTLSNLGPQLVHFGVALLLIGFVFSSFMQIYPATGPYNTLNVGGELNAGEYTVRLVSLSINDLPPSSGGQFNQSRMAVLEYIAFWCGRAERIVMTNLYLADGPNASKVESGVHIYKTVTEDVYLSFEWQNPTTALIQMKVVPMMNALWTGMVLLIAGLSVRFLAWPTDPAKEGF